MVAIILFFPVILAPINFFLVRKFNNRTVMVLAIPISIISAALGLFLLLSQIGIGARAFGLWGLLFALGTWHVIWKRVNHKK